jgi:hypothetical protein
MSLLLCDMAAEAEIWEGANLSVNATCTARPKATTDVSLLSTVAFHWTTRRQSSIHCTILDERAINELLTTTWCPTSVHCTILDERAINELLKTTRCPTSVHPLHMAAYRLACK